MEPIPCSQRRGTGSTFHSAPSYLVPRYKVMAHSFERKSLYYCTFSEGKKALKDIKQNEYRCSSSAKTAVFAHSVSSSNRKRCLGAVKDILVLTAFCPCKQKSISLFLHMMDDLTIRACLWIPTRELTCHHLSFILMIKAPEKSLKLMTKQPRQSVSSWGAVSESMSRFSQIREAKTKEGRCERRTTDHSRVINEWRCAATSLLDNAETMKYFTFWNANKDGNPLFGWICWDLCWSLAAFLEILKKKNTTATNSTKTHRAVLWSDTTVICNS